MLTKAEKHTGLDLSRWKVDNPLDKEQYYNCDAVIEAYLRGEKDGLKNEEKVLFNKFTENVDKTKYCTIEILNQISALGFEPIAAYIKFASFDVFQVIISVLEEDFIKEGFLQAYDKTFDLEASSSDELYTVHFSFLPFNADTIEEGIIQDGFVITLKKA